MGGAIRRRLANGAVAGLICNGWKADARFEQTTDCSEKQATAASETEQPRLLRADTAAIAALALWQALAGDGDRRPPERFEN